MELVERLSLLLAMRRSEPAIVRNLDGEGTGLVPPWQVFQVNPDPAHWKWARSNGVAIGSSWGDAARRAGWELVERDRILRSFYGELEPQAASATPAALPEALGVHYRFEAYSFDGAHDDGTRVAG